MKTMIPSLPHWPNGSDITVLLQLERTITRLGLPLGFDGDPLADRFPEADTHGDIRVGQGRWNFATHLGTCQSEVGRGSLS